MANVKGTGLTILRSMVRDCDSYLQSKVYASLTDDLSRLLQSIIPSKWIPVEYPAAIYDKVAPILFNDQPYPIRRLGVEIAERTYTGIYKLFLRIPTKNYVFQRTAQIYATHFDKGRACLDKINEKSVDYLILDIPELPEALRELACGHLAVMLRHTGAKNIKISHIDTNPLAWRWQISWD